MSLQDALLRAIEESNGDEAPRLIYADWCEEFGGLDDTSRIRSNTCWYCGSPAMQDSVWAQFSTVPLCHETTCERQCHRCGDIYHPADGHYCEDELHEEWYAQSCQECGRRQDDHHPQCPNSEPADQCHVCGDVWFIGEVHQCTLPIALNVIEEFNWGAYSEWPREDIPF